MNLQAWFQRIRRGGSAPAFPPELDAIASYSFAHRRALEQLFLVARDVRARQIEGDYVECGVHNGGTAAVMALALRGPGRHGWLYDSFAGMPATNEKDGPLAPHYTGSGRGSPREVARAMEIAGAAEADYTCRAGWFHDTFTLPLPSRVALLHVDCDWHESVLLSLRTFYDLVVEGGTIVLDDFGHWEGAREAFYDFCWERQLKPLLERSGHTQAFWIKGRPHNRDAAGAATVLKAFA